MASSEDFARLTDPFRPELLAHCYRMLGPGEYSEAPMASPRPHEPADPADRALLDRYATAFQNADVTAGLQLPRGRSAPTTQSAERSGLLA